MNIDAENWLTNNPDWSLKSDKLVLTKKFESFKAAWDFTNYVLQESENMNHHPKLEIDYDLVRIELFTHDTQSLTELDFKLAELISDY